MEHFYSLFLFVNLQSIVFTSLYLFEYIFILLLIFISIIQVHLVFMDHDLKFSILFFLDAADFIYFHHKDELILGNHHNFGEKKFNTPIYDYLKTKTCISLILIIQYITLNFTSLFH